MNDIAPNFSKVYSKANEILVKTSVVTTFPFNSIELVKEQKNIVCRSFHTAKKYGVNISALGSESAVIVKYNGKSIIFYDETKSPEHNKFSLLHELGHEINDHNFTKKDKSVYERYEVEANYFAAQLLMPEQLLREFQRRGIRITCAFLQNNFKVSATAAEKRIKTLVKTNGGGIRIPKRNSII